MQIILAFNDKPKITSFSEQPYSEKRIEEKQKKKDSKTKIKSGKSR